MKPLAFLCALLLCFSLVACSGGNEPATTTLPTTATTTLPTTAPIDPTVKTIYVRTAVATASDTMDARTEYIYDENNCLAEVIQYSGTTQTQRYSVVCDENGNFIQWNTTVGPLELSKHYAYDEQGNKLGISQYHNGELMTQTTYVLDNSLRVEIITVMPAQNQQTCTQYTYNSQGVRVREDFLINNVLQRYGVYTTDMDGRVASINYYLADGSVHSTISFAYSGLTETQTAKDAAGTIQQKTVITYDEHGNLLCRQVYNGQNVLLSTETHTWMAIVIPVDCPRKTDSALA